MEPATMAWTLAAAGFALVYWFVWVMGAAEVQGKRAVDLQMGSIADDKVGDRYSQYWSFFRSPKETAAAATADKVPAFVDTFYNLVTDIYEWGWGQSFHFSPSLPGRSHREATRVHEERVADLLEARPGKRLLDVGCGVGGPMRAIAAHSGADVVGITINEYQVNRARAHNRTAGLDAPRCEVVCGNFMAMPFPDASFDGAYSIEATCHAPRLQDVYGEVFRVLKPGGLYASYEWVTTPLYRADDPSHVEAIHGIERGDALPGLRRQDEIAAIAREVGFDVLQELDLALPPALPWWTRLKMGRLSYWRNSLVIRALTLLRVAPKGVSEVHEMLYETAQHLTRGGETGIFTPMHMVLLRKPESTSGAAAAAGAETK